MQDSATVPIAESGYQAKLSLTVTNGNTNAAPIAIRCLRPIRSIARIAESSYCEKQWATKETVVDIGVLNHTLFVKKKSMNVPPGCHTAGEKFDSLVWQPKNPKRRTNL